MTEKELHNLQIYIGKRSHGQTDEQVREHIQKINHKTPLTQQEWQKLIFPCCNNGYRDLLEFVLAHVEQLDHVLEYMRHTVYGRQENKTAERIEILKLLTKHLTDHKTEYLSETMIHAAWFGETEIVKFLIDTGANPTYQNANGVGLQECAERAEKIFQDRSLTDFLNRQENGGFAWNRSNK